MYDYYEIMKLHGHIKCDKCSYWLDRLNDCRFCSNIFCSEFGRKIMTNGPDGFSASESKDELTEDEVNDIVEDTDDDDNDDEVIENDVEEKKENDSK